MSDIERRCWYALLLSIVRKYNADDSIRAMRIWKEGKNDGSFKD